jgi:branched-subunit amino acid transport protein
MIDHAKIWPAIIALGLGSFALRFVFIGLLGDRQMPEWMLRHLRYTAVAILPALVAPVMVLPKDGAANPFLIGAGIVTLVTGMITKHVLLSLFLGGLVWSLNYWI